MKDWKGMGLKILLLINGLILLLTESVIAQKSVSNKDAHVILLNTDHLKKIAEVDERFQSYNIEMCEIVGGKFWIPYNILDTMRVKPKSFDGLKRKIEAIDLSEKKLRSLASALGPTYIRVSGTWANTTYFQNNDSIKMTIAPTGYENVLNRSEWKSVIEFCKAVNGKLVTSFAISNGMRDQAGNWTDAQMKPLLEYTKSIHGEIAAAEMFNEPSHASYGGAPKTYDANQYAKDFSAFKLIAKSEMPNMKILGPGSTGEGGIIPVGDIMTTDKIMQALPKPEFDIFSYHYYGGVSKRCMGGLTPEYELSKEWLRKTEKGLSFYETSRDRYLPGKNIWLTETAEAACGGNRWASTYLDCFRYLEQLGRLAKKNVQVVMHNTFATSEYALLDQESHNPRPNYWSALLWSRLMGTRVFEVANKDSIVDIFVHQSKQSKKDVTVLLVNPSETDYTIELPHAAIAYLLSSNALQSSKIYLNGIELKLNEDDSLPEINGKQVQAGSFKLPAHEILFLTIQGNEKKNSN